MAHGPPESGRPGDHRDAVAHGPPDGSSHPTHGWAGTADEDSAGGSRPPPAWPPLTPFLPPGPVALENLRPAGGGLLDLVVPWSTLAGDSGEPGQLSRIGPVTPEQACHIADLAGCDATVQWRVIVTDPDGKATAVTRVLREVGDRADSTCGDQASLVRRVTVTISPDAASSPARADLPVILQRTFRAAAKAAEKARSRAAVDAEAAGGCAHGQASPSYQPPPRLREFVTARDVTCRFPPCRQPVWRCDLDHSVPFDQGGRTCSCNLGGLCRFHHQVKQLGGWKLVQPVPGTFAWVTPAGRTYYAEPDSHAA